MSSVDKLGSSAVSSVDKLTPFAVSFVDKIESSLVRKVLPSLRESVGHVPAIPYVSGVVLVVISWVKLIARTF